MFASVICHKINSRKCLMIAEKGKEKLEIELKLPFFKTKKNIWIVLHIIKKQFNKNGFEITGPQLSAVLCEEYPNIPYVYY